MLVLTSPQLSGGICVSSMNRKNMYKHHNRGNNLPFIGTVSMVPAHNSIKISCFSDKSNRLQNQINNRAVQIILLNHFPYC